MIVPGGGGSLKSPENLEIKGSIITFDEVDGAEKYRIEITNQADESVIRRYVENGTDLNTLSIPEGEYMIKIQSISSSGNESEYGDEVAYKQADLYAVSSLSGKLLVDGNYIKWMGRTSYNDVKKENTMYYTASGFQVKVKKVEEDLTLQAVVTATNSNVTDKQPYVVIVLDGDLENTITYRLTKEQTTLDLIGGEGFEVSDELEHTVALYKRSESIDSHIALKSLETSGKFIAGVEYKERKIEMIAASSSTGYGNLSNSTKTTSNSDGLHAFAFLAAQDLNAEINIVSASGWGISASRWTSPNTLNMHDQYQFVDVFSTERWDTTSYVPDVIITNFGTNDLSYIQAGSNDLEKETRRENFIATYVDFIDYLHRTYPNAQIVILYGLMNESGVYEDHETIYARAKEIYPDLVMYKINGDAKGYNSHPSVTSHRTIADTLVANLKELMNW